MMDMKSYYRDLNLVYLQRVLDIERLFCRNVIYLSLAAIIISLLFIQHVFPVAGEIGLSGVCFLYASWGFFFFSIFFAAVMVFFSAIFKDVMFEETIQHIVGVAEDVLHKGRSHWSGGIVYIAAGLSALLFMIALACLLLFFGTNVSLLAAK